eukprot:gene11367-biopygen15958
MFAQDLDHKAQVYFLYPLGEYVSIDCSLGKALTEYGSKECGPGMFALQYLYFRGGNTSVVCWMGPSSGCAIRSLPSSCTL